MHPNFMRQIFPDLLEIFRVLSTKILLEFLSSNQDEKRKYFELWKYVLLFFDR